MNKIDKDELFGHLSDFFKAKGIELQEGIYTKRLQQGCGLLAETVNLSQQAFERAKLEMDKHLEQMREIIHQQTAPKRPPTQPQSAPGAQGKTSRPKPSAKKASKAKNSTSKRKGRT